jgi:hypothetical protein
MHGMPAVSLDLSVPLQRAALAEAEKIRALRARIRARLDDLDAERAKLRGELTRLQERERILEQISNPNGPPQTAAASGVVLRGAQLRLESVRLLFGQLGPRHTVHYTDWYDLVKDAGFVVLGKRPVATFLTAVSRSPIVARGDEPGTYFIEPERALAIRKQLAEVDAELADLDGLLQREAEPSSVLRQHRVKLRALQRRLVGQFAEAAAVIAETPESGLGSVKVA